MTEVSLSVVPVVDSSIPMFEGEEVFATKATITSVSALEVSDRVFRLDESVKMLVDTKVVGVQHTINRTTGKLERIHTFKAIDAIVVDWAVDLDALRDVLPE